MSALKLVLKEFSYSTQCWRIWSMLAWQDIKLRYRRSTIGPFWITISMAITIYSMGFLYGHLFRINLATYFPFLATGMVTWSLISAIITESTNVFIEAENFIRNLRLPYSIFVIRCILKNCIIFLHNLVAIIPIYFLYHVKLSWQLFLVIPGIFIILLNGVIYGSILGYLGTRYRDLTQIISSSIQVVFFLTPIMWMPEILPAEYRNFLILNPFYHYINLIRNPLIGNIVSLYDYLIPIVMTLVGLSIFTFLFQSTRNRLVFWL